MRTETAVQQYWETSLAWRGIQVPEGTTVGTLFRKLDPLYGHSASWALSRQVAELGDMIVRMKTARCPKPRRKLHNLVELPVLQKKAVAA